MNEPEPKSRRFRGSTGYWVSLALICNTLFFVFIQPILAGLANWLSTSSNGVIQAFIDNAYARSVTGVEGALELRVYTIIICLLMFCITFGIGVFSRTIQRIREPVFGNVALARSEEIVVKFIRSRRYVLALGYLWILSIVLVVVAVGWLLTATISFGASATFERSHMALLPYITDTEDRAIQGQWARVETKREYEAIMSHMAEIAAGKHAPPLPKREI